MAALVVAGLASCSSKEEPVPEEVEYGKLAFSINFKQAGTRA